MRCEIAASLLHAPRMLFLDEPTIGLDVAAKAAIRELLHTYSERDGVTLLLTSHDTGDIERVCTRTIVINDGRLLWDGSIVDLRRRYATARHVTLWTEAERLIFDLPGVRVIASTPYRTGAEVTAQQTTLGEVVDAAMPRAQLGHRRRGRPARRGHPCALCERGKKGAGGVMARQQSISHLRVRGMIQACCPARRVVWQDWVLCHRTRRLHEPLACSRERGLIAAIPGTLVWYLAATEWIVLSVPLVHVDVRSRSGAVTWRVSSVARSRSSAPRWRRVSERSLSD